VVWGDGR